MIYLGLINFGDASYTSQDLCTVLQPYVETPCTFVSKNITTICYGKLEASKDVDEVLENESSILIGRAFDNIKNTSLSKKDFKNFSALSKEEILQKIWGKYIYIEVHGDNSIDVVIDLTGQLPFFYYTFPNGNVFFASDIELIFKILKQKLEYNWTYLCSYLVYGNSSAIHTPFNDVYELPPGCCLTLSKNKKKTRPFWIPTKSYKQQEIQSKDAASVLQDTLKPWIKPYKNICVSLSGGLDSSALVYCLQNILSQGQTLTALNYFHSAIQSSNEVMYAEKVCEEVGIKLVTIDVTDCLSFDTSTKSFVVLPNKPSPGLTALKWLELIAENIPQDSCAFLNGHGSDNIFMRPPSKNSIVDYIIEKGFKGSKEQYKNVTHFYRDSLISVLKENVVSLCAYFFSMRYDKRNRKNIQDDIPNWITQNLYQKVSTNFVHPIYKTLSKKILQGKYDQIDLLYEGIASIQVEMNRSTPTFYPFLYEPVVKFALSFPTYELFNDGYDRYPLRKSICERFKTETVWRRDKGQTTGIFQLGVKKNLQNILELCLEGQFVRQGFIDKESLHDTIMLISNGDSNFLWPFTHLASVELFLKQWDAKVL